MPSLEVALTALVGVAGILGTLAASDRAHRSALALARTARGKEAAGAALDAINAMTDLLSGSAVRARQDELGDRNAPDYILAPQREEVRPHLEAVRRHLVEIPDRAVREMVERLTAILFQSDDVIEYSELTLSRLREGMRDAASEILGAYLRDEPIPAADAIPVLQTATAALAALDDHANQSYEEYLKTRPDVEGH